MVACSACGAQLSNGVSFCSGCGRPITAFAMPVTKKRTSPVTWLVLIFLIVGGIAAIGVGSSTSGTVGAPVARDDCKTNAFSYMLALKEGKSVAAGFWKPGTTPATLFAVRNFDEVASGEFVQSNGKPYKIPRKYSEFTVESSTNGGFAITKRWNVILEPSSKNYGGFPCAIVDLKEAQ